MTQQRWKHLNPELVREWWRALQPDGGNTGDGTLSPPAEDNAPQQLRSRRRFGFDRGDVARMRRAATLDELHVERAPFELLERLGPGENSRLKRDGEEGWLFLVAGTLAQVRKDANDGRSLALRLGKAFSNNGKEAAMSELRFQRLLRAKEPEDFAMQLRRAIQLANRTTDVAVLADDLASWWLERGRTPVPAFSMRYRWARDYFVDRKDQPMIQAMDRTAATTDTPAQEPAA